MKSSTRSDSMKKAHSEGRHPGWLAANRKNKSYPEKLFQEFLKKYTFFESLTIEDQFPFHGYFFDYAILDFKCDIEIDGVQHFRTAEAQEYDKKRDDFTLSKGWSVYRISAKQLKENPNLEIQMLITFLEKKKKFRTYSIDEVLAEFGKKSIHGGRKEYSEFVKNNNDEKYKDIIENLKKSEIDFSKYGWVKEASKIIGISSQKVCKWMSRFMPDFYFTQCYIRSTRSSTG